MQVQPQSTLLSNPKIAGFVVLNRVKQHMLTFLQVFEKSLRRQRFLTSMVITRYDHTVGYKRDVISDFIDGLGISRNR